MGNNTKAIRIYLVISENTSIGISSEFNSIHIWIILGRTPTIIRNFKLNLKYPWLFVLHFNTTEARSPAISHKFCIFRQKMQINPSSPVNKAKTLRGENSDELKIFKQIIKYDVMRITWSHQGPLRSQNPSS